MTVVKVWDGSGWVTTQLTGAQYSALDSRLSVVENRKGQLLDVQAIKGNGLGGLVNISSSGDTIPVRVSSVNTSMEIVYTPTVDVWWEVNAQIGYIETTTAVYADAFAQMQLNPVDLIADADTEAQNPTHYSLITQRSDVDARALRVLHATWKLAAGVTYTTKVILTFSANAWRTAVGYNAMYGKAWTR